MITLENITKITSVSLLEEAQSKHTNSEKHTITKTGSEVTLNWTNRPINP